MNILEIVMIGVGLAMDCFAVSIASSVSHGKYDWAKIVRMALAFGVFQGVMPLLGWLLGVNFAEFIRQFDHWIAFGILGFLGCKMIVESMKMDEDGKCERQTPYSSFKILIIMAFATSIDALATGLIFVPFDGLITFAGIIIGVISFLFTLFGCIIGISFGNRFKLNVELIGGLILIAIGTKILIEHLCV